MSRLIIYAGIAISERGCPDAIEFRLQDSKAKGVITDKENLTPCGRRVLKKALGKRVRR
jgi:hypothetical protein